METLEKSIEAALLHRRQVLVHHLAKKFYEILYHDAKTGNAPSATGWIQIESLSQLRAHVGGRFQNLKQRWIGAGFPLREHRGDRSESAEVDQDGWLTLVAWLYKQGFEARLPELVSEESILEIKKLESDSQTS